MESRLAEPVLVGNPAVTASDHVRIANLLLPTIVLRKHLQKHGVLVLGSQVKGRDRSAASWNSVVNITKREPLWKGAVHWKPKRKRKREKIQPNLRKEGRDESPHKFGSGP